MIIKTPFDLLNVLGTDKYYDVANVDKKRNFFIVNRMLSRTLPDIVSQTSQNGIVPESVLDFWNLVFVEYSKSQQGRNILKTIRKNFFVSMASDKKKEEGSAKIDKELLHKFIEVSKMSMTDFKILQKFYEKDLIKYLKDFSRMIKTSE